MSWPSASTRTTVVAGFTVSAGPAGDFGTLQSVALKFSLAQVVGWICIFVDSCNGSLVGGVEPRRARVTPDDAHQLPSDFGPKLA